MVSKDQIIDGCRAGRQDSFRDLYKLYAAPMLGVCYRYSKNLNDAEDIVQEGFIKVFQKIDTYNGSGVFDAWIRRIMVNTAINHYKANLKIKNQDEYSDNIIDINTDVDEEASIIIENSISTQKIMDVVQNLPSGYRMVFNMFVVDGMGHKEIANVLGISENTSKSQLRKSRIMLRNLISEKYGEEIHNII